MSEKIDWVPGSTPKLKGPYTISVKLETNYIRTAQAYYFPDENEWYQINPYDVKVPHSGVKVNGTILGWVDGLCTYGGMV